MTDVEGGNRSEPLAPQEQDEISVMLVGGPMEVLDFLIPLWAGQELGLAGSEIGLLVAAETGVSLIARPWAGWCADRFDRAGVVGIGALLVAGSFLGYVLAGGLPLALLASAVGGLGGAMFWVALRARVGSRIGRDPAGFDGLFAAENFGVWTAYVIGLSIFTVWDFNGVFLLGALACVVAAFCQTFLGESRHATVPRAERTQDGDGRVAGPLLGLVTVTGVAEAGIALLVLLHLQDRFDLDVVQTAAVFIPGFVVLSVVPGRLQGLIQRFGRRVLVRFSLLSSACFAAALSLAPAPAVVAALWALAAAALAIAIPIEETIISEQAGRRIGRAMARYEAAGLLGATIGTGAAGLLYGTGSGWAVACWSAAALLCVSALLSTRALDSAVALDRPSPPARTPGEVVHAPPPHLPVGSEPAEPSRPATSRLSTWRAFAIHVIVFVIANAALHQSDLSWPGQVLALDASLAGLWDDAATAGDPTILRLTRTWTWILLADLAWTVVVGTRRWMTDVESTSTRG